MGEIADFRACPICKALTGQNFSIKERKAGVNFPPFHAWCRCSFTIAVSDWENWLEKYSSQNKSVANSGESGIINTKEFNSIADPMYEVTGSAFVSNPKEIQEIIEQLKQWGVDVNYSSSTLGYGCVVRGKPGVMSITKDASYSAWCHEFQHVKDDKEAG